MDLALLGRTVVFGFTVAAAVGPISLLTIRRTLVHGRRYGLASGLGVALADGTYAAMAAFGLTAVTSVLVGGRAALGAIGGAVVVWLAIRTMTSRPTGQAASSDGATRPGLGRALVSIYGLTMTNPMTILSFTALFAALGIAADGALEAATLTLGVFVGSGLWWVALTTTVAWLRSRVTVGGLLWVNRVSGAVLLAFGLATLAGALALSGQN